MLRKQYLRDPTIVVLLSSQEKVYPAGWPQVRNFRLVIGQVISLVYICVKEERSLVGLSEQRFRSLVSRENLSSTCWELSPTLTRGWLFPQKGIYCVLDLLWFITSFPDLSPSFRIIGNFSWTIYHRFEIRPPLQKQPSKSRVIFYLIYNARFTSDSAYTTAPILDNPSAVFITPSNYHPSLQNINHRPLKISIPLHIFAPSLKMATFPYIFQPHPHWNVHGSPLRYYTDL